MPKIIENPEQIILEHAREILLTEGYQQLNMRNVAKACGLAIGTLYNYFPTKDDLVYRVMLDYWQQLFNEIDQVDQCEADLFLKLREVFSRLTRFVETFREVWITMNTEGGRQHHQAGHRSRQDSLERLVAKVAEMLHKAGSPGTCAVLGNHATAQFIVQNFVMMCHMRNFSYNSFETILAKVLS